MPRQQTVDLPARRVEYGELPDDAEFLEVAPGHYAIAREFMRTGRDLKAVASALDVTPRHVRKELAKICRQAGCAASEQLLYALRTKQLVLVEVHHHGRKNWLTRISPAADPVERTPGG